MFITYHRVGKSAVLPALAAAGALVVIGGIAAMIAVAAFAAAGAVACGIAVLRACGLGGRTRTPESDAGRTIEGTVVTRSSSDGEPSLTRWRGPALRAETYPRGVVTRRTIEEAQQARAPR